MSLSPSATDDPPCRGADGREICRSSKSSLLSWLVVKLKLLSNPVLLIANEPCSSTVDQYCTFPRLKLTSAEIHGDALHLRECSGQS
ncbi:hypothetical protein TNCV_1540961 [Trichonephila clavipes]|nr:hypothetical protein TNCV_1540961 [Trichonephila clavipes]